MRKIALIFLIALMSCSFINFVNAEEKKSNPNVGLHIKKEDFMLDESKKERSYPKKIDTAVPANMKCGKVDN